MRVPILHSMLALSAFGVSTVWVAEGKAQTTVRGRVVANDSTRAPVAGAQLNFPRLGVGLVTDSVGRFIVRLDSQGTYALVARAVGFKPETTIVQADVDAIEISDIRLVRLPQVLGEVLVEGESESIVSRISGFEERRKVGIGTFIDRAMLDKLNNMRTANILATRVPGLYVLHGRAGKSWAISSRAPFGSGGAFGKSGVVALDPMDARAGAKPNQCYLDVYLNGAMVYNSKASQMPLFDLNSISPDQIESIEVYTGASQIPTQFNRTGAGCGVMVIWMR